MVFTPKKKTISNRKSFYSWLDYGIIILRLATSLTNLMMMEISGWDTMRFIHKYVILKYIKILQIYITKIAFIYHKILCKVFNNHRPLIFLTILFYIDQNMKILKIINGNIPTSGLFSNVFSIFVKFLGCPLYLQRFSS